jgi:parvulin-like peptidyl-prolyl isomerase
LSDLLERGFDPLVVLSVLQVLIHGFQAFGLFGDDHHQVVNQIVYREVLA